MSLLTNTVNKRIIGLGIVLLTFCGISLLDVGSTKVTPFYLYAPFLVIFFLRYGKLKFSQQSFLVIWGAISVAVSMISPLGVKLISLVHFLFYLVVAVCMTGLLKPDKRLLLTTCKMIIFLYFFNICLAMILTVLNIPYGPLSFLLKTYYNQNQLRYSGFASEPSYAAIIVTVSMICILQLTEKKNTRSFFMVLLAYYACVFLAKTTFGLLSGAFVVFLWLSGLNNKKRITKKQVIGGLFVLSLMAFVVILIVTKLYGRFMQRIVNIVKALLSSVSVRDAVINLASVDSSAWYRVGPFLWAFEDFDYSSIYTWIGHGVGWDPTYYTNLLNSNTIIRGGFWQAALYNQGILGVTSFGVFLFREFRSLGWLIILYYFFVLTNCAMPTQLFWFIFLMLFWLKLVLKKESIETSDN